VIKLENHTQN